MALQKVKRAMKYDEEKKKWMTFPTRAEEGLVARWFLELERQLAIAMGTGEMESRVLHYGYLEPGEFAQPFFFSHPSNHPCAL